MEWFIHIIGIYVTIILFHFAVLMVAIIENEVFEVLMNNAKFRNFIKKWYDIESL